ncbi:MAG TPA: phosphatidate cytidylyltransferase [Pyrinomonadaceae bacterium]|nr:phosphatidate cytidylyltransferase [Pyrinomonadaceae bacterium]
MKTRILTAVVALPVLIGAIVLPLYYPQLVWVFIAIGAFGLGAALFEFFSLTKKLQLKADAAIAYLASGAFFVGFVFDAPTKAPDLLLATIGLVIIATLVSQTFRFQKDFSKLLTGVGVTLLGVFYIAFLGGFLVAIRTGFENAPGLSTHLLGYFFLVLFGSDAGAYFAGRALGKHKLAPAISPGKTVEGLIGGIAAAGGLGALATWTFFPELPYVWSVSMACVLASAGVLGDLFESAIKRGAGAKDAATILPGHGGFLDRLDSLLFGAPILYYFARFYFY